MQTMQSSIASLQHQFHALSCTVSRGHAPASSSSVSVNIDNQRPSTSFRNPSQSSVPSLSQIGQTSQGFGNAAVAKRKPKNKKKQQNNQIQQGK
ncbi:unnamed protein product [Orchesella dallaii]|uniref:Uncharacterized protein n=1 Tax=Orchesella dallaii TaxID=48710 RepID=A0ABP1Q7V3_9HEXA